jgi:hypothetical protein
LVGLSFLLISLCFPGISSSSFPHIYANTLTSSATITKLQISAILNQTIQLCDESLFFLSWYDKKFSVGWQVQGVSSWIREGHLELILLGALALLPTTGQELMLCGKGLR